MLELQQDTRTEQFLAGLLTNTPKLVMAKINTVFRDEATKEQWQNRVLSSFDPAHVKSIARAMRQGEPIPPSIGFLDAAEASDVADDEGIVLLDGWHRDAAYRKAGKKQFPIYLVEGATQTQLVTIAVLANKAAGLALNDNDHKHNVLRLVQEGISGTEAAKAIGVNQRTVRRWINVDEAEKRMGRLNVVLGSGGKLIDHVLEQCHVAVTPDSVFDAVVTVLSQSPITVEGGIVNSLLARVKAQAHSEVDALQAVKEFEQEYATVLAPEPSRGLKKTEMILRGRLQGLIGQVNGLGDRLEPSNIDKEIEGEFRAALGKELHRAGLVLTRAGRHLQNGD